MNGTLSSSVSAVSLKATLCEEEVRYWTSHFFQLARAVQYSLLHSRELVLLYLCVHHVVMIGSYLIYPSTENINYNRFSSSPSILQRIYSLPVSVVTTVDLCDWLLLVRLDSPSLQSVKDPLCKMVMADARSRLQVGPAEGGKMSLPVR